MSGLTKASKELGRETIGCSESCRSKGLEEGGMLWSLVEKLPVLHCLFSPP